MTTWTDTKNIKHTDEGLVVMAAFRYCLSRQSYIVGSCIDFLKKYWGAIDNSIKDVIEHDLKEEVDLDYKLSAIEYRTNFPLDSFCYRAEWIDFLSFVESQKGSKQ